MEKKLEKTEQKLLQNFLAITFVATFVLGIIIYFAKIKGLALMDFALFQMFLPAFGAIIAILISDLDLEKTTKNFYRLYIIVTAIIFVATIFEFVAKDMRLANYFVVIASLVFFFVIIFQDKSKKEVANLNRHSFKEGTKAVLTFIAIYIIVTAISLAVEGGLDSFIKSFKANKIIYLLIVIINFFLSFLPFLGEEYGWRFFLQPILQKKYRMRMGLILVGLIWGVWHLPLNLFFYSASGTELASFIKQILGCIALAIFLGYAYTKTGSIWVPTIIHYLNNNLAVLFSDNLDPNVIQNISITWSDVILSAAILLLTYGLFIFTKYDSDDKYRVPSVYERFKVLEDDGEEEE